MQSYMLISLLLLLLLHFTAAQLPCNGYPELCAKPFNAVSYVTTHNAFAVGNNPAANQWNSVEVQLNDGVRAFMFDTHLLDTSQPTQRQMELCHLTCVLLDAGTLVATLSMMKAWLDAHPREVITIFYENYDNFAATEFIAPYTESGLLSLAYYKAPADPWPTLEALIDSNKRVITTVDRLPNATAVPWLFYEYDYIWESPFSIPAGGPYYCNVDRPASGPVPSMYVLNHFVYTTFALGGSAIPIPNESYAVAANGDPLSAHVENCLLNHGIPNYVAVDFYEYGEVFELVATLNGVTYTGNGGTRSSDATHASPSIHLTTWACALSLLPLLYPSLSL